MLCVFVTFVIASSPAAAQRIKRPFKLTELEKQVAASPYDAAARYNVALGYWNAKQYDEAEQALKKAVELDPRFAQAYLALAYLPYARRPDLWKEIPSNKIPAEWQPAVQEMDRRYRQAFLVDPFVDLRITGAVEPPKNILWVADPTLSRIYDLIYQGFDDFRQADYESAYRHFDTLVKNWMTAGRVVLDSIPPEIVWYRGLSAAQLNKTEEAVRDVGDLLDRSEKEEKNEKLKMIPLRTNEYRYVLGSIKLRGDDLNGAAQLFVDAAKADIGLYMAHVQLANVYEMAGRLPAALAERQRAVEANPDDRTSLIELAETQYKAKKLDEARKSLETVVASEPYNVRALYTLGVLEAELGDKAAARKRFEEFLKVVPARFKSEIDDVKKRISALGN
jgi:tetratricopeptide (TPR) repeat protein